MSPLVIAAVTALVAGGAVRGDELLVAYAPGAAHEQFQGLLLQKMNPPPDVVVRTTKRYGTVTVDHKKHLALRAPCRACHEELPVGRIEFTPQVAHRACIGCHKERVAGPTQCTGCHVRSLPAPEPEPALAEAETPAAEAPAPPAPTPEAPRKDAAPLAAPAPLAAVAASAPAMRAREVVEVGLVAGSGFGPSLRVTSRRERFLTTYSFERVARAGDARLIGMLGLGYARRIDDRWEATIAGMGGFDAIEAPAVSILPAVGARFGFGWRPRWWRFDTIHVGVTGVYDVMHDEAFGQRVGGATVYATLGTGVAVRVMPAR